MDRDGVMAVDGIVESNSEVFFHSRLWRSFTVCPVLQATNRSIFYEEYSYLMSVHAHVQFQDFPVVLPYHYISCI